ncbi:MAG: hypothetical protein RI933_162 [Actinomycetota bacterium]|jgi:YggT family protein|uniref:YggT family protein n=1 Tax=Candidatus Rhodoluna planktonica TaxID=535712 RepID=A0A1D9DZF9_9MICO|nr:YggT family protein [Candidatus Rhodoluna planktonica]AOY56160.1 hypothetical protein A4Z71_04115 [Candidatus Rhodoluna planktonica]
MTGILGLIWWALEIYFFAMVARLFIDLVLSVNPSWRPRGIVVALVELVMTVTDPPLKFARRFIKPIRFGVMQLDFGWTLVVIAIFVLQSLISGIS